MLTQDGEHVHPFVVRRAQHLDDFSFGIRVARFPISKFDNYFVSNGCWSAQIARFRNVDIVRDSRIIRDDKQKLFASLQCADNLSAFSLEDAHDSARLRAPRLVAEAFGFDIAPHQHAIAVECRRGGAFRNDDFLAGDLIGQEKTFALTIDTDHARQQIRLARLDVTIAFRSDDLAADFKVAKSALQFLLLVWAQPQSRYHLGHVQGGVITSPEKVQNFFFHKRTTVVGP